MIYKRIENCTDNGKNVNNNYASHAVAIVLQKGSKRRLKKAMSFIKETPAKNPSTILFFNKETGTFCIFLQSFYDTFPFQKYVFNSTIHLCVFRGNLLNSCKLNKNCLQIYTMWILDVS